MNKYNRLITQDIQDIKNNIDSFFPIGSTTYDVNGTTFYESELTLEDNTKGYPIIALESLKTRLGTSLTHELNKALENFGSTRKQFVDSHLVMSSVFPSYIYSICYGNGKYVVGCTNGKMAYSTDGITWTAVADSTFGSDNINFICYGNGKYVAGGYKGKMAYSTDGVTWTAVTNSTFGSYEIYSVSYGNGKYVAVGSSGKIAYYII